MAVCIITVKKWNVSVRKLETAEQIVSADVQKKPTEVQLEKLNTTRSEKKTSQDESTAETGHLQLNPK